MPVYWHTFNYKNNEYACYVQYYVISRFVLYHKCPRRAY